MLIYSIEEILLILIAAIVVDLIMGDPRHLTHPVVMIGKLIRYLELKLNKLNKGNKENKGNSGFYKGFGAESRGNSFSLRIRGVVLTVTTVICAFAVTYMVTIAAHSIHSWAGYCVSVWLISTTIAIKGLKNAAMLVYIPLLQGDLHNARKHVSRIVGRDTEGLNESEITRATVETVAENVVDAVVSPIVFALLGGAPMAMLYRATNTLDSMVGYKNDKYRHFGWASARWDDILNWLPARITGLLLVTTAFILPRSNGLRAWQSIRSFATQHPSPNSGIPESAVAGALGIQLGGRNIYEGVESERARMGLAYRDLNCRDILQTITLLYSVSFICIGGLLCAYFIIK